jgi:hypothetical protein
MTDGAVFPVQAPAPLDRFRRPRDWIDPFCHIRRRLPVLGAAPGMTACMGAAGIHVRRDKEERDHQGKERKTFHAIPPLEFFFAQVLFSLILQETAPECILYNTMTRDSLHKK